MGLFCFTGRLAPPSLRLVQRLTLGLLLCGAFTPAFAGATKLPPLTVTFFDVGQGDAALIRSPTGKTVLIDGGPPESSAALATQVAKEVQGPLDLVILSHPHLDHLGGLPRVLKQQGARRFLDPGFDHPTAAYRDLLRLLNRQQIPLVTPELSTQSPSFVIGLGEGVTLTVLWPRRPLEPFLKRTRSDANANSLVVRLNYQKVSVLFTGDAESTTEARLLAQPGTLSSTVLKVAHHGSSHSSTRAFLAQVHPEIAVISAGQDNEYGHPAPATLKRLARIGTKVLRTDLQGNVKLTSDGVSVQVVPTRQERKP